MNNKSKSCIVSDKDGEAFWQPGVKGNCITIKVSPWNIEKTNHTIFLHELPKDGQVLEHFHQNDEEIFICLDGEGIIMINGKEHAFKQHDIAYIAPLCKHSIKTISEISLKLMVIISPTGLEDRLKMIGIPKTVRNSVAPEKFEFAISNQNTHGVVKN